MTTEEMKMNGILKAFGRLVCGMTKRHGKWRKHKSMPQKECKRCGETVAIKRRAKVAV